MRTAAIVTAVLLGSLLVACGGSSGAGTRSENFAAGGTFTTSIATDPGNLDPHQAANNTTLLLDSFAYDSLINRDESGNPVPQLASTWDITPTSVTFTLRKDVTCADGTPLTASHVAANFEYVKKPESQSSVIGSDLPDSEFTVAADDAAGTVTITREEPYGFLLPGAGGVAIVCPKGTADRGVLATGTDGTGPFTLVEAVAGDHYTFAVRKEYRWGPNGASADVPGFPDKVVFKVVQNPSTGVSLMLSGQLNDVAVVGTERQRLAGKGFVEQIEPGSQTNLLYNQADGHPGADLEVRRALTTAINIDQFRKVLTEDDGVAPTSLEANKGKPCTVDALKGTLPGSDATAAKAALDRAGWTAGADGVRAKAGSRLRVAALYPAGTPSFDAAMELLGGWWKQLGVEVEIKGTDANALNQLLFSNPGGWDVVVLGLGAVYPSQVVGFFSGPVPPDGQNFPAINNPDYDRLVAAAGPVPGQPGCDLWAQAERALFQRFDVIPLSIANLRTYLNKVRYASGEAGPEPSSIRLLA